MKNVFFLLLVLRSKSACFALQYRHFYRAKQVLLQCKTRGIAKCCSSNDYNVEAILQNIYIFLMHKKGENRRATYLPQC